MPDTNQYMFEATAWTYNKILGLPGAEQVALYNRLGEALNLPGTVRFADNQTGAARTFQRLKEYGARLTKHVWPDDEATGSEYKEPPIHEPEPPTAGVDDSVPTREVEEEAPSGTTGEEEEPADLAPSKPVVPPLVAETPPGDGEDGTPDPKPMRPVGVSAAKTRRSRAKYFNFPAEASVKEPRPGTLRDRVLKKLLASGLVFEEVVAEVSQFDGDRIGEGKDLRGSNEHAERRAYEVLRIIHYTLGYGLRQGEDGRITAFTK